MTRPSLSVCIITYNQVGFLPFVLANVEGLADEIVVLDSFSTDGTAELAAAHPKVRFSQRPFTDFGSQKNALFELAQGDWILNVDQDELLGDTLRAAVPRLVAAARVTHYKLPRYWVLSGPPWRYVDSEAHTPDWCLRLFRNQPQFRYASDQVVHHHFPREGRGTGKKWPDGHIFHFDFVLKDRAQRVAKYEEYMRRDPRSANTHRMELYEEHDFRCRACKEPLTVPGLAEGWWRTARLASSDA
ncbi:MAG: glycosyltransferase family 2 protein [Planctomycetes bacterium]|nr:glycosyltransferase family 2 protein [Planctomycetota bacterium]